MSEERKTAAVRDRELRLAIARIEKGRSKTNEIKLTIAAVAREAGVSTAQADDQALDRFTLTVAGDRAIARQAAHPHLGHVT